MSQLRVAKEIVSPMSCMLIAVNEEEWSNLTPNWPAAMDMFLKRVIESVRAKDLRKNVRD